MFFDKPVNDLTFEDVVQFCQTQQPEGKQLDYKYFLPKNKEKFAKTIASFANALGGTVIIGVNDDKNDKPKAPFTGIPYHEKMRNTIEDIIQTYIDPIVFVDVNTCVSKDGQRMFVVVNIPQSNLTPHLVGKLKRAYIRTGQSSRRTGRRYRRSLGQGYSGTGGRTLAGGADLLAGRSGNIPARQNRTLWGITGGIAVG